MAGVVALFALFELAVSARGRLGLVRRGLGAGGTTSFDDPATAFVRRFGRAGSAAARGRAAAAARRAAAAGRAGAAARAAVAARAAARLAVAATTRAIRARQFSAEQR
jgi:hypothetical protein